MKFFGIEPAIRFHSLEDGDETEEGEEEEILVITTQASQYLSKVLYKPLNKGIHIWL